jgi:septal ring factor EnvC (AmiA/AmiB activator)
MMCGPLSKKFLFASFLLCLLFAPVFSQGVWLTESEYQELMSIIRASKANSQEQTNLIADLKNRLATQEAKLLKALTSLEQSGPELTELKAALSRIRTYSDELNKYCLELEQEIKDLKSKNRGLKIGLGTSSGVAGALAVVLLIVLLL